MEHDGSSVTLIFYRVGDKWWKEPILNIIAAAAQMSTLTHVEIAIGGSLRHPPYPLQDRGTRALLHVAEEAGTNGMMKNVCRVFNDKARPLHARACASSARVPRSW